MIQTSDKESKPLNAVQFVCYIITFSVGVALALPHILWLRPIGILVASIADISIHTEQRVRKRLPAYLFALVALMSASFIGVMGPWEPTNSWRPHPLYAVCLAVSWAAMLAIEYRQWIRTVKGQTDGNQ
jgi:hypothetical protein